MTLCMGESWVYSFGDARNYSFLFVLLFSGILADAVLPSFLETSHACLHNNQISKKLKIVLMPLLRHVFASSLCHSLRTTVPCDLCFALPPSLSVNPFCIHFTKKKEKGFLQVCHYVLPSLPAVRVICTRLLPR